MGRQMDLPSRDLIDLLTYLLPGFVAAATLYTLTPSPRPTPFERVIEALIFTILVQAVVLVIEWIAEVIGRHGLVVGVWSDNARLVWSVVVAAAIGVLLAALMNNDMAHSLLRRLRVTQQTSYSSEWYGAFCKNNLYVVLHLNGDRRLYGWPEEWPSVPGVGHFILAQAEWLEGDTVIPLPGVDRMLIRAADVEMVEFMNYAMNDQEVPHGRPQGTDAATDPDQATGTD